MEENGISLLEENGVVRIYYSFDNKIDQILIFRIFHYTYNDLIFKYLDILYRLPIYIECFEANK